MAPIEDIEISDARLGQVITIGCRVSTCQDNAAIIFSRGFEILNRAELSSNSTSVVLNTELVASDSITGTYTCQVTLSDIIYRRSVFRITRPSKPGTHVVISSLDDTVNNLLTAI